MLSILLYSTDGTCPIGSLVRRRVGKVANHGPLSVKRRSTIPITRSNLIHSATQQRNQLDFAFATKSNALLTEQLTGLRYETWRKVFLGYAIIFLSFFLSFFFCFTSGMWATTVISHIVSYCLYNWLHPLLLLLLLSDLPSATTFMCSPRGTRFSVDRIA